MLKGRFPEIRAAAALMLTSLITCAPAAHAIEMDDLYTVEVALDPSDPDARENAYATALAEVLVRVTGIEGAAESEDLMGLFPTPARYVLQFRRGEDSSLVVSLDGNAIEALLRRAGQPVWGNDRPLTIVWLAVDWGLGEREIVGADDPDDLTPEAARSIDRNRLLRERVMAAAERRGIPVLFPLLDTEDLQNVSFSDIWGGFHDSLIDASRRYGSSSVMVGRVRGGELFRNRWDYYFGGQQLEWSGGPETAVNLMADALAEQFAYAGDAPVESVVLSVAGVDSVSAYGTVQRFLRDLSVIDGYQVESVEGDQIRFRVRVQGGTERLASALEFSGILQRRDWRDVQDMFGTQDGADTLDYVYRPFLSEPPAEIEPVQPSAAEIN